MGVKKQTKKKWKIDPGAGAQTPKTRKKLRSFFSGMTNVINMKF